MAFWVDLVCCSSGGLHWSGWVLMLVWSGLVWCVYGGVQWSWALVRGASTHYHLRCSQQRHRGLCLTPQMKVSFYEARDVPAVRLCFHPRSLLNVSRRSRQSRYGRTEGRRVLL